MAACRVQSAGVRTPPIRHRRARPSRRRRLAAPRHPRDGGCGRAQFDDLHRPRHHHDHPQGGPGADAHDADGDVEGVRAHRRDDLDDDETVN